MSSKLQANEAARVLIVDDHPAVREALVMRISQTGDMNVCGEAADIAGAIRQINESAPDAVIIDISLKDGDGIDLIKRIRARFEDVRMLVWSMHSEEIYAERALRAGAHGYITKERATTSIVEALREVLSGRMYLADEMKEHLLQLSMGQAPGSLGSSLVRELSDRELEVFRLIGEGRTTQDIAQQLHLSPKTIETYRDRIRHKLGLRNGAELARKAFTWLSTI